MPKLHSESIIATWLLNKYTFLDYTYESVIINYYFILLNSNIKIVPFEFIAEIFPD